MKKAFKYRIYPTKKQESMLDQTLGICCELYNAALQERRDAYKLAGKSITYTVQQNQLPEIKQTRSDLKDIHSQVLQDALRRLDKAFDAFFRRVKNGENPGYPRFRSRSRYHSFTYTQTGFEINNRRLALSKIGHIKINLHRPLMGIVKTLTIKRTATGKWFAIFSCEVEPKPLPACEKVTGLDAGLESFATHSSGEKIPNPRFFRQEEKALRKAQRYFDKVKDQPGKEREEKRKVVARVHERITNKRKNFAHQESRHIVKEFGIICIEDLAILNMLKNHCLAKSIADAAWSLFFHCIVYKVVETGRQLAKEDSRHTSQDCHRCGHRRKDLKLTDRVYHCTNAECLISIDRDQNAALNVLALGLQRLGLRPIEAPA
jgi:putative transposase